MITTLREYWLLPALTLTTFGVILIIHAVLGGNPLNRIGYALFISLLPALITLAISNSLRLRQLSAIVIYIGFLVLTTFLQGVIRQW